jgi:hypothetical protein
MNSSLDHSCHGTTLPRKINSLSSIRSPGSVAPRDVDCEGLDLTYTRIATDKASSLGNLPSMLENDVDKKVDSAIEAFLRSLSQIGPELMSVRAPTELFCGFTEALI